MARSLPRQLPSRLAGLLLCIVAVGLGAAFASTHTPRAAPGDTATELRPAAAAAAERWLAAVPLPAGFRADPTFTACPGEVADCAVTGFTPAQAATRVVAAMRQRGASPEATDCVDLAAGGAVCWNDASHDGYQAAVDTGNVNIPGGLHSRATWVSDMIEHTPPPQPPAPEPLPPLAALRLVPAWLRLSASCAQSMPGGCQELDGDGFADASPATVLRAATAAANFALYAVQVSRCRPQGCMLIAVRNLGRAGARPVVVGLTAQRGAHGRTAVRLRVDAQ